MFLDITSGSAGAKEPACWCRRSKRWGFDPWVGKIPWWKTWQPTPVFLPWESHGQRSLAGYSPWDHKSRTWLSDETTTATSNQAVSISPTQKTTLLFSQIPQDYKQNYFGPTHFKTFLKFRTNKWLWQLGDTGPLRSAWTHNIHIF